MTQLSISSRTVCFLLLAILLITIVGCNTGNNYLPSEQDENTSYESVEPPSYDDSTLLTETPEPPVAKEPSGGYTICFQDTSNTQIRTDTGYEHLYWRDVFSFEIIQIYGMHDSKVAEIANENIKNAMVSWISGKIVDPTSVGLAIFCHSDRYLSFVNTFEYTSRRTDCVNDYITIDMTTGKRVMLNDLVEINEDFVRHIQKDNVAKALGSTAEIFIGTDERMWAFLGEKDPAELLEMLEECSLMQEQVIQNGDSSIEETIGPLIFRNSFYMQEGRLVIVLKAGVDDIPVTFLLDDIIDYLKVEKW